MTWFSKVDLGARESTSFLSMSFLLTETSMLMRLRCTSIRLLSKHLVAGILSLATAASKTAKRSTTIKVIVSLAGSIAYSFIASWNRRTKNWLVFYTILSI